MSAQKIESKIVKYRVVKPGVKAEKVERRREETLVESRDAKVNGRSGDNLRSIRLNRHTRRTSEWLVTAANS